MDDRKLILASSSPQRKNLMTRAGLKFEIAISDYEEKMEQFSDPYEMVKEFALGKAKSIADKYPNSIIIGADTVVSFENKILGKPHTAENAFNMLKMLNGKWNSAISGLAIIDTNNSKEVIVTEETRVRIRALTDEEIWAYVNSGEPLDKAGAYNENMGSLIIEKMEGDIFNAEGLPLQKLAQILLTEFDYKYWINWPNQNG